MDLMSRTLYRKDQLLQRASSVQNYLEKKNCKHDPKPQWVPSIILIHLWVGEVDSFLTFVRLWLAFWKTRCTICRIKLCKSRLVLAIYKWVGGGKIHTRVNINWSSAASYGTLYYRNSQPVAIIASSLHCSSSS